MAAAYLQITWVQQLLQELKHTTSSPLILWCDNFGATFLIANLIFYARTKYIEIDYHFVHEKVTSKSLLVQFICSNDQLADLLIKGTCCSVIHPMIQAYRCPWFQFYYIHLKMQKRKLLCF
jgi:hypothetical protein